ncbi:MAG: NADH:ubiquinone reductase (Na(+)-transporting) subunit C [Bacteroidales bacterium]|nr:NADH:ubiquinone reductase (Na(+)-transporting) subunit C [Bacteroidales bacterium]
MKKFSNTYIFIYSAILVAVVAVLLSLVATSLKDKQQSNVTNEKMQSLLKAINVEVERDAAPKAYEQYFTEEMTVTTAGAVENVFSVSAGKQTQGSVRPFDVNLKEEQKTERQKAGTGRFPIYRFDKDGKSGIVLPLRGTGLWGAVWGYIALADDCSTVKGITFDHEGETPGLGAEIANHDKFQTPFIGKQILDEQGRVVSIAVKKHAHKEGLHEVDALSGGTMTSNGVNNMLATDLKRYQKFFDQYRNK